MCRLFGLSGGGHAVSASFWLLEADDALVEQSRVHPDGYGIGTFSEDGEPMVDKAPLAAWSDAGFAAGAREATSRTFMVHLRHASTGVVNMANTHPFAADERLFGHNGVVGDLPVLEERLGDRRRQLVGDTDSERLFALVTAEIAARDGDVGAGIEAAVRWIAATVPLYSLNFVLATADELWALRYPDTNPLLALDREACPLTREGRFEGASRTVGVAARTLEGAGGVVVASERIDPSPGWRMLEPGELLHVDADLACHSSLLLPDPPTHQLTLEDLGAAAATQAA